MSWGTREGKADGDAEGAGAKFALCSCKLGKQRLIKYSDQKILIPSHAIIFKAAVDYACVNVATFQWSGLASRKIRITRERLATEKLSSISHRKK